MVRRTKTLTAVCLSLLYGLVGFTGESLHYLVQDLDQIVIEGRELADAGYFHSHGSHSHVHFHRHEAHVEEPETLVNPSPEGICFKYFIEFHQEHACPLLTLVSQFKLGYYWSSSLGLECQAKTSFLQDYLASLSIKPTRTLLIRGPPSLS